MSRTKFFSAVLLSILIPVLAFAQASSAPTSLKPLPAPKEVRVGKGSFAVTSTTRIFVKQKTLPPPQQLGFYLQP
jgi:hypothetical protein